MSASGKTVKQSTQQKEARNDQRGCQVITSTRSHFLLEQRFGSCGYKIRCHIFQTSAKLFDTISNDVFIKGSVLPLQLLVWVNISIEKLSVAHCQTGKVYKGDFIWDVLVNVVINAVMLRMVGYSLCLLRLQMRRNSRE